MGKAILGFIGVFIFLAVIGFATGEIQNLYDATIGKQQMDIQRTNFEHSKSYVNSKIEDLANYKREYDQAKDDNEKQQVQNFVIDEFADFDPNQIENPQLYNFLIKMEGTR